MRTVPDKLQQAVELFDFVIKFSDFFFQRGHNAFHKYARSLTHVFKLLAFGVRIFLLHLGPQGVDFRLVPCTHQLRTYPHPDRHRR